MPGSSGRASLPRFDRLNADSRIPGFFQMKVNERIDALASRGVLSADAVNELKSGRPLLSVQIADRLIENVIGTYSLPLAVAPNFRINDRDYLVPMVVEEPSIVAGLSGAAKLARSGGGFAVDADESLLAGQIQVVDIDDPHETIDTLKRQLPLLRTEANRILPKLVARGGGCRDIEIREFRLPDGQSTVVLHLLIDTRDAMGANLVNTVCERLAPRVEALAGGRVVLRILSNLADRSLVTANVKFPLAGLKTGEFSAEAVRDGIVMATQFADVDPHRAATHNKGIMNGVDAIAIATGNDWRAIEASAHAYAARDGAYRSLSAWTVADDGDLRGQLSLPLKVGTVGGSLRANPGAELGLSILGVETASELAAVMVSVGLAQNFAALRALVTHGIQRGHMRLHARSVASSARVRPEHFDSVVAGLIASGDVKTWKAEELSSALSAASGQSEDQAEDFSAASVGVAAGKVILLGEHAAVYDRHAVAVPLAEAVVARIIESDAGMRLTLAERGVEHRVEFDDTAATGIGAALNLIMRRLKLDARSFSIRVESRIPTAMGLGSSAAFVVAIIRAFDRHCSLGLDNRSVNQLAFDCEKLAHGTPSGIDNNLATYGEPVLFSKGSATRTKSIVLKEPPPIVVASSGIRGVTKDQVAGVRARFERNSALYNTIFDEIDEISVAGAIALRDADYATLGSLMNVCHGLLNAIEVSLPELETMIQIARESGAIGAKLTGAGGGGSIVALCPGCEDAVAGALKAAGHAIIRLRN